MRPSGAFADVRSVCSLCVFLPEIYLSGYPAQFFTLPEFRTMTMSRLLLASLPSADHLDSTCCLAVSFPTK